ncbi:uncharacterized protein [Argopecten irradians]|uniref:uncharacterized protein isoform X2 n=1 Tax=Argopecten irradians TaxID=31199 RepID=UPI003722ED6C
MVGLLDVDQLLQLRRLQRLQLRQIGGDDGQRRLLGPLTRTNLLGQQRLIGSLSGRNLLGRRLTLERLGQRGITPLSPLSRLVGGRRLIGLPRRGVSDCTCRRRCLAGISGDICLLDVDRLIVGRVCCQFPLAPFTLG